MGVWLWAVIGVLCCATAGLLIKVHLLRKTAGEIQRGFARRLMTDTNTLIDLSHQDRAMEELAAAVNRELKELRRQRQRYLQGDQELKEAVTGISHDLRTPLTAICGYLDLLEQEELSAQARTYLSRIENRVEAMKELTEELFRYSVVTAEQELAAEPVDLRGALEESLLSFYGALEAAGIEPEIHLPQEKVLRCLDPAAVSRIFGNMISNAVKYSDGDLRVDLTEDGTAVFSNAARNLDAVAAGRLFDRFYTVETARNSTGLGLSIARQLTERMGGSLSADYEAGRLRLILRFPYNSQNRICRS